MFDLHAHILPEIDDGPKTWEESLEMARLAVADGLTAMVATPHLFQQREVYQGAMNARERILAAVKQFREKLAEAGISLEIYPGCEAPLFLELPQLLAEGLVVTINDGRRYLFLELPDTVIPPATESFVFRLHSSGTTPIITHPERHVMLQEMLEKLVRLLNLGCLAQITAASLLGGFGRRVASSRHNW